MSQLPELRLHTDAIEAVLEAVPGLNVGEAGGTDIDGNELALPYVIVNRSSGALEGPLDAPYDDGRIGYQIRCVGESEDASEGIADRVRATVLALSPDVIDGRRIIRIEHVNTRGPLRDVRGGERWFTAVEEFAIWTTPRGAEEGS